MSSLLLVLLLGVIDYVTGPEIAFSAFYLLPISSAAWFVGRRPAFAIAAVSALGWLLADITQEVYSQPWIPYWNMATRLAVFVLTGHLLTALRAALTIEQALSRRDSLTGAVNSRHFYELAGIELERSRRYQHPFTLAYIDLDNFKAVNDHSGHTAGDQVLITVVSTLTAHLRATDGVARLGGDEFAVLMPETGPEAAQSATAKLQACLLDAMHTAGWPVTFSIGVQTFQAPPESVDAIIKMADSLMYTVKHNSKNAIRCAVYPQGELN
jgi:diguanylate cyclase (GGDEF)-like protein